IASGEPQADMPRRVVGILRELGQAASGRRVARALGGSPTTATAVLTRLREMGVVESRPAGRSVLWSVREDAPALADLLRHQGADVPQAASTRGARSADASHWAVPFSAGDGRSSLTAVIFTAIPVEYDAVRG